MTYLQPLTGAANEPSSSRSACTHAVRVLGFRVKPYASQQQLIASPPVSMLLSHHMPSKSIPAHCCSQCMPACHRN